MRSDSGSSASVTVQSRLRTKSRPIQSAVVEVSAGAVPRGFICFSHGTVLPIIARLLFCPYSLVGSCLSLSHDRPSGQGRRIQSSGTPRKKKLPSWGLLTQYALIIAINKRPNDHLHSMLLYRVHGKSEQVQLRKGLCVL